jgi:hypothetical protein
MDDKCVLAGDLERFLERCAAIVEDGEHVSVEKGNLIAYRGGSFMSHASASTQSQGVLRTGSNP